MTPSVKPVLPLALLETIRVLDRPTEVLEDENLAALPGRLGLTDVVETQIQRFEKAVRQGRDVPADEVRDLIRLVLRRPDAEELLREAGRRVARRFFDWRRATGVAALKLLPQAALWASLRRAARLMLAQITAARSIELRARPARARRRGEAVPPPASPRPFVVRVTGALTAGLEDSGRPCVLYAGALEQLVALYTGQRVRFSHASCETSGADCCEWELVEEIPEIELAEA